MMMSQMYCFPDGSPLRWYQMSAVTCVVPNQLPVVVSEEMVVEDAEMEKFVLIPEACPVVSMTSTAELTFGPFLSEVF